MFIGIWTSKVLHRLLSLEKCRVLVEWVALSLSTVGLSGHVRTCEDMRGHVRTNTLNQTKSQSSEEAACFRLFVPMPTFTPPSPLAVVSTDRPTFVQRNIQLAAVQKQPICHQQPRRSTPEFHCSVRQPLLLMPPGKRTQPGIRRRSEMERVWATSPAALKMWERN